MAAGAIPPPLFFEQRRCGGILASGHGIFKNGLRQNTLENTTNVDHAISTAGALKPDHPSDHRRRIVENMANTTSAKKATRKIARRTIINKSRRTQMRGAVRTVEEAIKSGDRDAALKAMARAEPELMQAAQRNIIHKNNASRKVSRLTHQIAKLAK
jgi:small subunit ribosomal protein S20